MNINYKKERETYNNDYNNDYDDYRYPKPTAQGAVHENRGELLMSIKNLELQRTREDGKTYTTTFGTMHEDAQKQREKVHKKYMRKAKRAEMLKKWKPKVLKGLKILGKLAVVGVLLYFLFWIVVGGIVLMAVGAGMVEGGRDPRNRGNRYY